MNEATEQAKQFAIQKLYIKDVSFESPGAPHSFSFQKWEPKIDLNLTNTNAQIDGDLYEAVLCVTATVSLDDKTIFLVEVHYAGLFLLSGFDETERKYLIGSQCMNILFPYVREVVSDLTTRGGFPPLLLSPVNFDALYQQHMQKQGEANSTEPTEPATH
jgi:preprotein translocase subunit SecB